MPGSATKRAEKSDRSNFTRTQGLTPARLCPGPPPPRAGSGLSRSPSGPARCLDPLSRPPLQASYFVGSLLTLVDSLLTATGSLLAPTASLLTALSILTVGPTGLAHLRWPMGMALPGDLSGFWNEDTLSSFPAAAPLLPLHGPLMRGSHSLMVAKSRDKVSAPRRACRLPFLQFRDRFRGRA